MTAVRFEVGHRNQVVPIDVYTDDLTLVGHVLSSEDSMDLSTGSYLAIARDEAGREVHARFEVLSDAKVQVVGLQPPSPRDSHPARAAVVLAAVVLAIAAVVRRISKPQITRCANAVVLRTWRLRSECVRAPAKAWRFLTVELGKNGDGRPELDVRLLNVEADNLLRSLDAGEFGRAEVLSTSQALSAEDLLGGKRTDPIAAAAGGYALLRMSQLDRLHDWTQNLLDWFPWLSDGAVIHAELLARRGQHADAMAELCELPARGLPVFSTGVSLAADRLRLYTGVWPNDTRLVAALTYLSRFAVAVDFTRPVTTYTCRDPDTPVPPGSRRPLSIPSRPATGRTIAGFKDTLRRLATMDRAKMIFAAVVTAIFIAGAILLITRADSSNPDQWARLVYVFGAFEAIAFTAVGWVFGAEVNRQRADSAEKRADQATQEKDTEAEKGRTLAGMVIGRGSTGQPGRPRLEAQGGDTPSVASDPAVDYARTAYNINI
ncbi:hypothetical protein [Kribbella sp. NPDC050459]|uniref:hypothetical protein n=1 Tax=Kribbella sp. NPDC050459 TaxID=3155785 RepID=UPI0033C082A3